MLKQLKSVPFATAVILCLMASHHALAEPTSTDQSIQERAQKKLNSGLIFMEAKLFRQGNKIPDICQRIWVTVASANADKGQFITQSSPTLFGHASDSSTYGGWAVLNEGTYIVSSIWCEAAGGRTLKGPFAGFVVRKGPVLNLGRLVIEYSPPPFHWFPSDARSPGVWRVEDLSAEAVTTLTKRAPAAFARATKRYMTPVAVKPKPPAAAPN
jgi:hypothetical protein